MIKEKKVDEEEEVKMYNVIASNLIGSPLESKWSSKLSFISLIFLFELAHALQMQISTDKNSFEYAENMKKTRKKQRKKKTNPTDSFTDIQ